MTEEIKAKLVKKSDKTGRYTKLDSGEGYLEFYNPDDIIAEVWVDDLSDNEDASRISELETIVTDWVEGNIDTDDLEGVLADHDFTE